MTREEIIAQAKEGGFAVVRIEIRSVDRGDFERPIADIFDNWIKADSIVAIEPPPKTAAERLDELQARYEVLLARIDQLSASLAPSQGNT